MRPTQAVQIFGNIFTALGTLAIQLTSTKNFTEIMPGEPLRRGFPGEPLRRGFPWDDLQGAAKYSDFGPIDGYISETVQDRR